MLNKDGDDRTLIADNPCFVSTVEKKSLKRSLRIVYFALVYLFDYQIKMDNESACIVMRNLQTKGVKRRCCGIKKCTAKCKINFKYH